MQLNLPAKKKTTHKIIILKMFARFGKHVISTIVPLDDQDVHGILN